MPDLFTLGTTATFIAADPDSPKKITNRGASTIGRNTTSAVVSTDNSLTTGQSYVATTGFWYISAASSGILIEPTPSTPGNINTTPRGLSNVPLPPGTTTLTGYGTDAAAADNKTVYLTNIFVPTNTLVTGVATLNGTNITTDKIVNYLFSSSGSLVAQSAAAGTAPTPADTFQETNFTTTPIVIPGPATYWVGRQHNGTTIGFQSVAASTSKCLGGSVAGTSFGAETSVVPPTTFTADKAPFAYLY